MLADLDETIKKLLSAEVPIKNGEIGIEFDQPIREWSGKLTKPMINFFMYDVRENVALRQHQWEQLNNGNGNYNVARMKRTPFRVDCTYMITTWAAEADDEHRLLSRVLLALFRNPILTETYLVGGMQDQPFEIQTRVAANDKLTNPAEIWSALDNELRPSVSYIVTIAMDPWVEVTGPPVRTFTLRTGQSHVPAEEKLFPESAVNESFFIGGTVTKRGKPQANISVALKGTGYFATSDENGRFQFTGLSQDTYTLVAWPDKGKPKETKFALPGKDYDIKL